MKTWTDLGNGKWKLVVEGGGIASTFRGTREEIAEQLADSQANANSRISQLRSGSGGAVPPQTSPANGAAPRPLTPEGKLEVFADLSSPATVDKGVARVVESLVGPLDEFRRDRSEEREERLERTAIEATKAFVARTPEWFPSEHNNNLLVNYMKLNRLSPQNTQHYTQAFEALKAAQLLQARPADDETNPETPAAERNAPTPTQQRRPSVTRTSTSIRSSDISGRRPEPTTTVRLKYSREQLANMSATDYKRLMQTDGAELERCEAYYAKHPAAPARKAG